MIISQIMKFESSDNQGKSNLSLSHNAAIFPSGMIYTFIYLFIYLFFGRERKLGITMLFID